MRSKNLAPLAFSASLALLGSLGGCATTPKAPGEASGPLAKDYAPLALGLSWTYSMSYPGQKGEMTVTILGERDGYFVDDHDGVLRHTPEGLRDKQRYLIRQPLEVGATWKTVVSASAVEHNRVLSVGEKCESAAGAFQDCLVIESSIRRDQNVTLIARWTWAKGIGLVKLETEAEIAGKGRVPQVKQSLVRYGASSGEPKVAGKESPEEGPNTWTR